MSVGTSDQDNNTLLSPAMHWLRRGLTRKLTLLLAALLALQLGIGIFGVLHIGAESSFINDTGRQRVRTLAIGQLARQGMNEPAWHDAPRVSLHDAILAYDEAFDRFGKMGSGLAVKQWSGYIIRDCPTSCRWAVSLSVGFRQTHARVRRD